MSKKGYQLIDVAILDKWCLSSHKDVYAVLLQWVVKNLREEFFVFSDQVEIEVIPITYVGTYLGIGVHYKYQNDLDISEKLKISIVNLIEKTSLNQFLDFYFSTDNWYGLWDKIIVDFPSA